MTNRPVKPYNPLSKKNLGISVARALLDKPVRGLPPEEPPRGAGIYVLYYRGDFAPYRPLSTGNVDVFDTPIYVGRAHAPGRRTGGMRLDDYSGTALKRRLGEHAKSIRGAENLEVDDFQIRYLVVDDIWVALAETLLISQFQPLWNCLIDGFGNHDPGKGRRHQARSDWDVLHPGRHWAEKLAAGNKTRVELEAEIRSFLADIDDKQEDVLHPEEGD
jgi:hypothetical protein